MSKKKHPHAEGHYHYNARLRNYAHENRHQLTKAAVKLWTIALRKRQMLGYQFRRERPIGWYIADFVCLTLGLVIEVDGSSHHSEERQQKDRIRDQQLRELGFTTLRFTNRAVIQEPEAVIQEIRTWIERNAAVPPPRARKREQEQEES